MPDLTYFIAVPKDKSFTECVTTLSTGNDEEDKQRLIGHCNTHGYIKGELSVFKFTSVSSGEAKTLDGKDVYRHHLRQEI